MPCIFVPNRLPETSIYDGHLPTADTIFAKKHHRPGPPRAAMNLAAEM